MRADIEADGNDVVPRQQGIDEDGEHARRLAAGGAGNLGVISLCPPASFLSLIGPVIHPYWKCFHLISYEEIGGRPMALATERRPIGKTGLEVTVLGLGGAPLGDLFEVIPEPRAEATIAAAWDLGVRLYDTAPLYGRGVSEHRFGHVLRQHAGERDEFVLCEQGRPLPGAGGARQGRPLGVQSAASISGWSTTTATTARCGRSSRACSASA